jgi:hypothetical protein
MNVINALLVATLTVNPARERRFVLHVANLDAPSRSVV